MVKYVLGFYLVAVLQGLESSGLSPEARKTLVESVVRISKRQTECVLLVTEALPVEFRKALGALYTGALVTLISGAAAVLPHGCSNPCLESCVDSGPPSDRPPGNY